MFACVFPSISTSRLGAHNRYVCLISESNCFVGFCWQTSSDSVHIMTGNGFYSKPFQQTFCLCLFLTYSDCLQYQKFHKLDVAQSSSYKLNHINQALKVHTCSLTHIQFLLFLPPSLPPWSSLVGPGSLGSICPAMCPL